MDWSNIMKQYKGKWVALADDEKTVVASAKRAIDASKLAEKPLRRHYAGILGQKGFFEDYSVKFEYPSQIIIMPIPLQLTDN
ncbi:MAG TPA: DUF5678 domain-containing protein [Candidatus Saccharimonadia bacterium]